MREIKGVKVKVLVYSLALTATAINMTLPASQICPSERTPLNLQQISKCRTFGAPIDPLSVQSGMITLHSSPNGFYRPVVGFKSMPFSTDVQCTTHQAMVSLSGVES